MSNRAFGVLLNGGSTPVTPPPGGLEPPGPPINNVSSTGSPLVLTPIFFTGGPGGPRPPGGGVAGVAPPLRGVAEARRAGARGSDCKSTTSPLLSTPRLLVLLLALLALFSTCELYGTVGGDGANIEGSLPLPLRGQWAYIQPGSAVSAELYGITDTAIEYGYGGGASVYDYAGTIAYVSNYSSDSGVIIVHYDPGKKPRYPLYNDGDFGAVYYRNLRTDSVQLANAINLADMSAPDTVTLEEAVEKFTRMTMGAYVDWGAVQPQQRIGE